MYVHLRHHHHHRCCFAELEARQATSFIHFGRINVKLELIILFFGWHFFILRIARKLNGQLGICTMIMRSIIQLTPFPPHFWKALGISLGNPSLKRTAPLPSHCRIICRALWGLFPAVRVSATSFAAMSDARARAGWIVK